MIVALSLKLDILDMLNMSFTCCSTHVFHEFRLRDVEYDFRVIYMNVQLMFLKCPEVNSWSGGERNKFLELDLLEFANDMRRRIHFFGT